MKFIFNNQHNENYIVKFHEVHLYYKKNNNKLQYLFVHPIFKYKKYIIDIDYYDFKKFIVNCSKNKNIIKLTKKIGSVKNEYIKLTEKIVSVKNINLRLNICQKLGELIFFNHHHKNVFDIKHIYTLFTIQNNDDNLINSLNCHVKYLIIMINNLLEIECNLIKDNNFDMLDFIYDYYLN
jgi:hypothetical protein